MKKHLSLFTIVIAVLSGNAFAEIYKRVDAEGRVTYSNVKTTGATRLEIDPDAKTNSNDTPKPGANKHTATPEGFPKVDKETQNQRDNKRGDILKNELTSEKAALDQAKQAYAEGESNPEVFKTANGGTGRNVAKFNEKMKTLQADVDSHQKNVELLQKELDALK